MHQHRRYSLQNSVFEGHSWTFNAQRGQYYYHQFAKEQPDLNYRNPAVITEMSNVLTFWLDQGADGFRVDAINHMFEDEQLRDEPVNEGVTDNTRYAYTQKIYTKDLVMECALAVGESQYFTRANVCVDSRKRTVWCTIGVTSWTSTRLRRAAIRAS